MLKAIGASTSSVGKSLNSQVAASVQKIKPEAQDSVVRKLLRGMVTRADMEGAPSSAGKKTLGIMTPQGVSEMRVFKCLWFLFYYSCLWCSSSRSSYDKKKQKKRYKQK